MAYRPSVQRNKSTLRQRSLQKGKNSCAAASSGNSFSHTPQVCRRIIGVAFRLKVRGFQSDDFDFDFDFDLDSLLVDEDDLLSLLSWLFFWAVLSAAAAFL